MNRYLLDTHVLYRWLRNDRRLGRRARKLLAEGDCYVSVGSVWEMLLKSARGKLPLPQGSIGESIEAQGFSLIAIGASHVETTMRFERSLPDPFDRLLVATATVEGMLLLTQDAIMIDLAKRIALPVAEATT